MVVGRLLVLVLGFGITLLGVRAYRRHRSGPLRNAALGFGLPTTGVSVGGGLYHVAGVDLVTVHLVESVLVSRGFGVSLASLR